MSAPRTNAAELVRWLNSSAEPIYVLDDDLTVVFLNRACQQWLGDTAAQLLGCRCAYHSSASVQGPEAVAARLCPPPQVLTGESTVAVIAGTDGENAITERRVRFLPLGSEAGVVIGVVAMVEPVDAPPPSELTPSSLIEPTSLVLHEQIARFRQEAASHYRADRLIGSGPAMQLARRQVELASQCRDSVLLVGLAGSGRSHLAAAIHYGTDWPAEISLLSGGLISLDCSLLGVDLIDSLISAMSKAKTMGKSAASGSMLFHRIDELSSDVQTELVMMLGRRTLPLRLIATAAQPLLELARRGMFRTDLAALFSTIVIELPPLSQRRDDVPILAQLFLEDINAAGTRQIGGFTPAALDALDAYAWAGNLDELATVVAEAHRRAAGPEIDVDDLPKKLHWAAQTAAHPRRTDETIVLEEYLARVERELIRRALTRCKGNKARAARLLGMTRPRLYRRMVQLGLE